MIVPESAEHEARYDAMSSAVNQKRSEYTKLINSII